MPYSPQVSVIIPTYNRAYCLAEAIESVLSQTFQDFELIVVDDGSTDATARIICSYKERLRYIRQDNAGVSAARNAGIRAATGDWIAFLDSDDQWLPEKLAVQIEALRAYPTGVAHMVDVLIELPEGKLISAFELRGLKRSFSEKTFRKRALLDVLQAQFFTSSWLLDKETVKAACAFETEMRIYEDLDLLTRVALFGPFVISCYPGVILRRRQGDTIALSNLEKTNRTESLNSSIYIYRRLMRDERLNSKERRYVKRQLGGILHEMAVECKKKGDFRRYWQNMIMSITSDPCLRSIIRALLSLTGFYNEVKSIVSKLRGRESFRRSDWITSGAFRKERK